MLHEAEQRRLQEGDVADAGDVTSPTDVPRADTGTDVPTVDVPTVDVPTVDAGSDVPATDVPATDVPGADVAVTDVPVSDVPATDAATADGGDASVGTVFEATLSGAQEVPAVASAATGTATITLNAARTAISYVVRHTLAGATSAARRYTMREGSRGRGSRRQPRSPLADSGGRRSLRRRGVGGDLSGEFSVHQFRPGVAPSRVASDPQHLQATLTARDEGTSATFELPAAGTYPYYCLDHEGTGMYGAIRVR
ncbi:MAG: CHRD domain-containing protein [Deltaproteobacteria bacterium]|nr:CHRD domain-containing protein [Deltaproteobacteria bacterium]